ncbi:MAG: acyl carrier protein [Bacteroidales bacterium]|nr:acyl carrier protein [Bacteroidales bacterium]
MEKNEIIEKLTLVFHEVFGDNNIVLRNDMSAADIENWDSLTHMLMITKVEEVFGIRFKLKELNKLKNVGDLCNTIEGKLQG